MKTPWNEFGFCFPKPVFGLTIFLILSVLSAGCTLMQLREETKTLHYSTILAGNVSSAISSWDMPVVVAAYAKQGNTRTVVHYTRLHELGSYELFVPKGNYYIVAFGDKNRNLVYDRGEPAGKYTGAERVAAPAGGVVMHIDIVVTDFRTS